MSNIICGKVLSGNKELIEAGMAKMSDQSIDQEMLTPSNESPYPQYQTTLEKSASVTGPGTFFGKAQRTLTFTPTTEHGWFFDRVDRPRSMPINVSVTNVWTTVRNIVLCSGSPHNYMRMVEHIIALKTGMGIDNLAISMDSGDPPLFDRSSMDIVEAFENAQIVTGKKPANFVSVKEPVTIGSAGDGFLTFLPPENGSRKLTIDCAVDFKTAIGKQRIIFDVTPESFRHGAFARTNTSLWMMLFSKTIGMLFADTRNLGYTTKNILIAGPKNYFNTANLIHNGKSLEACWHRATLDLLAAIALIDHGRFIGKIISYKAGHALDVQMIRELYYRDMIEKV